MKHSDFPLFMAFSDGAFQANSGGHCTDSDKMQGTQLEYDEAELQNLTFGKDFVYQLGMLADDGYVLYEQDPGTDESKPMFCFELLGRYY